jgi:hypothetical protein
MDEKLKNRNKWIDHNGKKILFSDFRDLSVDDYFPVLDEAIELVKKEKPNSIYTISAHSKIHISEKLKSKTEEFKRSALGISKGTAAFGLEGIQKVIVKALKKDVYFAKSMEDALDWFSHQP